MDAATILDEFGSWRLTTDAAAEEHAARFLVVGSGRQERDAWAWLHEMSGHQPRRLLAGGRWRELVPRAER